MKAECLYSRHKVELEQSNMARVGCRGWVISKRAEIDNMEARCEWWISSLGLMQSRVRDMVQLF